MFVHNKKLQYTVHVDAPNVAFAKLCLEQFGGPNGELGAAMRYFTQGWAESDVARRDMLLDIATEELSHLEMIGQLISGFLKGAKGAGALIDEIEGSYLGELLEGKQEKYQEIAWNSQVPVLTGGAGLRLTDSMGTPWTAAYIDSIGHPLADLRSDIAAEARAKVVYDRLIKLCPDPGAEDARASGFANSTPAPSYRTRRLNPIASRASLWGAISRTYILSLRMRAVTSSMSPP
jgi:Mn-containing catalase